MLVSVHTAVPHYLKKRGTSARFSLLPPASRVDSGPEKKMSISPLP